MSAALVIRRADPMSPPVLVLLERHLAVMRAASPPESVHALDPAGLAVASVQFFTLHDGDALVGMGAIKAISPDHAEIKSMHVVAEARGRGLAATLLDHLLAEAQRAGFGRVSLETGTQDVFAPARRLYARAGFAECPPFEGYEPDPNSVFMTREV